MSNAAATISADLTPKAPFDFAKTLAFHGQFAPFGRDAEVDSGMIMRAMRLENTTLVFQVKSTGTIEAPRLNVTFYGEQPLTPETLIKAVDRVGFFLSIHDDLQPFYELARADPPFLPVLENQYGYHQVKFLTPFENACWSILTQRTNFGVALTFKQRIIDRFGSRLVVNGTAFEAFPQPDDFGAVDPGTLAELVSNERRGSYLHSVVTAFQDVDEDWLRSASYAEVEAWLRSIQGIGEWAAYFILLRGLGRTEKALIKDDKSHLIQVTLRSAEPVYGAMTPDELRQLARHYGSYQGYWAHYLRANSV